MISNEEGFNATARDIIIALDEYLVKIGDEDGDGALPIVRVFWRK